MLNWANFQQSQTMDTQLWDVYESNHRYLIIGSLWVKHFWDQKTKQIIFEKITLADF
jgi:hypothetical protein